MKWKLLLLSLTLALFFTHAPVSAYSVTEEELVETVSLTVNDEKISGATGYKHTDTVYIPFRAIFEHIGIKFEYDSDSHCISYLYQDEAYKINLLEDVIFTPNGDYQLFVPIMLINQRTYIPQEFIEELLRLEVEYSEEDNVISVRSMEYAHNGTIHSLAESYYKRDIPAKRLFTFDSDPYGSLSNYDTASAPVLTTVEETHIGTIKYLSTTEAVVMTSQLTSTPAVTTEMETELRFRNEDGNWKINKFTPIHLRTKLLDDIEEKASALKQISPDKVDKLLSDLRANYEALKGDDFEAAINAYSPLLLQNWNENAVVSWEDIVEHSIKYPSSREDLLEANVIYMDEHSAAVYVKTLYTEFPQNYDGEYEPGELDPPHEYESILYLDYTNGEHWTFNKEDTLNQNY